MSHPRRFCALLTLFSVALALVVTASTSAQNAGGAQKEIVALAKALEAGRAPTAQQLRAIQRKYELEEVMELYKPTTRKGLGIDRSLDKLGRVRWNVAAVGKYKAELLKTAALNRVLADVTKLYKPNAKFWATKSTDLKKAGQALVRATNATNPAGVSAALQNITASCNGCHKKYRD